MFRFFSLFLTVSWSVRPGPIAPQSSLLSHGLLPDGYRSTSGGPIIPLPTPGVHAQVHAVQGQSPDNPVLKPSESRASKPSLAVQTADRLVPKVNVFPIAWSMPHRRGPHAVASAASKHIITSRGRLRPMHVPCVFIGNKIELAMNN